MNLTNLRLILGSGSRRHFLWLVILAALAIGFRHTLVELMKLSLSVDHYSHLIVIPLLSSYLLWRDRARIFLASAPAVGLGISLLLAALPLIIFGPPATSPQDARLFVRGMALFILVIASFILSYGVKAFRAAAFPLLFLVLAVPLPAPVVDGIILGLQTGSAAVSELLFAATGVPFLRRGLVFYLPALTIEIAQECSGIRSSIALLLTTTLAAHLLLNSWWKKLVLVASVVPLVLLKNGLRIVTISLLGAYVDPGFLTGWLHTSGGIVFYLLALALIGALLRLLRWKPAPAKIVAHARTAY